MPISRSQGNTQEQRLFDSRLAQRLRNIPPASPDLDNGFYSGTQDRSQDRLPSRTINFEDVIYQGALQAQDTGSQTIFRKKNQPMDTTILNKSSHALSNSFPPIIGSMTQDEATAMTQESQAASSTFIGSLGRYYQSSPSTSPSPSSGSHAPTTGPLNSNMDRSGTYKPTSHDLEESVAQARDLVTLVEDEVPILVSMGLMGGRKKASRGKVRTERYGEHEKAAKAKSHHRAMQTVSKKLEYISKMHPETQFFFYARSSARQNVLIVSKGLEGIDTSRSLSLIHNTLDEFAQNGKPIAALSFQERFQASALPVAPTFDDVITMFEKSQSSKSIKPIFTKLREALLLQEPRMKNATWEWYLDKIKPLFSRESRIPTVDLWKAFHDLNFHGSTGLGYKYKEFRREHLLGLLQTLDLRAKTRGEPPLPQNEDFAGKPLFGSDSNEGRSDEGRTTICPQTTNDLPESGLPDVSELVQNENVVSTTMVAMVNLGACQ